MSKIKKRKTERLGKVCAVYGCENNSKKIAEWNNSICIIHNAKHSECPCLQPYKMHRLPTGHRDDSSAMLRQWLTNINRKNFKPTDDSRVCSIHFIDGEPTSDHPYPVINMGYDNYKPLCSGRPVPRRRVVSTVKEHSETKKTSTDVNMIQSFSSVEEKTEQKTKDACVQWCDPANADHSYAMANVQKVCKATQTDDSSFISADEMNENTLKFYTGLSKSVFWEFINSLLMWNHSDVPNFKLNVENQILLVFMRIRLGLMFFDLSVRFNISQTTACTIFKSWLPVIASYMKANMIFWLPRDTLFRIRPKCFEINHPKATCIIDCTEVFVQRPKDLMQRAQTYSNYKHHNTYKALFCIAPNGFVTYVSKLFGGRASDTFISKNSGFSDHLLPGDEVLADRGFTIEGVLPPGVKLSVPAFTKSFKDRLLPEENVTETRRIANVRIHVERAIRRLKCFKILSNVIPGNVKNVDDILVVCAGLCNLQPCLINEE